MSRTGDCYDNAVAESFFASLKAERVDHEALRDAPPGIRRRVHRPLLQPDRRHSHLDYVSPIEFELKTQIASFAA